MENTSTQQTEALDQQQKKSKKKVSNLFFYYVEELCKGGITDDPYAVIDCYSQE